MHTLRTPDARFANLPEYPFAPQYVDIDGMRMHYVDAGSPGAAPVLLMHGEPTWSYLYRKMIPIIGDAGHRAVAPDLIGFGKSDKPAHRVDYTYARHVGWMAAFLEALDLRNITLVCQDWGSLIGLRLAAEHEDRFERIVLANGALPAGHGRVPMVFRIWQQFARWTPTFPIGRVVNAGCVTDLSSDVIAAYDAPFPDETYKQGARAFPALVPTRPNDPAAADNQRAWEVLHRWRKPFLTAFSDGDPITRGGDRAFQLRVPGAQGQPHTTIRGAGHFLQEDKGPELARVVVDFIDRAC
jgi:haloalkane dehalogenase